MYTLFIWGTDDESSIGVCHTDNFKADDSCHKEYIDEFNNKEELAELLMEYFTEYYETPEDALEEATDLLYWCEEE
jgi:hypothetical protein